MNIESLASNIQAIQDTLQQQATHAVNMALTTRNWLTGYYIVEYEQNGEDRAAYGEFLFQRLEERLKDKGMNVRRFRKYVNIVLWIILVTPVSESDYAIY